MVGPKKLHLAAAERDLATVMAALKEKQDALQQVVDKIQALNDDLGAKKAYSDRLQKVRAFPNYHIPPLRVPVRD